jgi:hypothetical protein
MDNVDTHLFSAAGELVNLHFELRASAVTHSDGVIGLKAIHTWRLTIYETKEVKYF